LPLPPPPSPVQLTLLELSSDSDSSDDDATLLPSPPSPGAFAPPFSPIELHPDEMVDSQDMVDPEDLMTSAQSAALEMMADPDREQPASPTLLPTDSDSD
jgi:hypothetical protein